MASVEKERLLHNGDTRRVQNLKKCRALFKEDKTYVSENALVVMEW